MADQRGTTASASATPENDPRYPDKSQMFCRKLCDGNPSGQGLHLANECTNLLRTCLDGSPFQVHLASLSNQPRIILSHPDNPVVLVGQYWRTNNPAVPHASNTDIKSEHVRKMLYYLAALGTQAHSWLDSDSFAHIFRFIECKSSFFFRRK